jgi:hypothetical protein
MNTHWTVINAYESLIILRHDDGTLKPNSQFTLVNTKIFFFCLHNIHSNERHSERRHWYDDDDDIFSVLFVYFCCLFRKEWKEQKCKKKKMEKHSNTFKVERCRKIKWTKWRWHSRKRGANMNISISFTAIFFSV